MVLFKNIKHSISRKLLVRVFSIYFVITLIVTAFHMYQEYQYTKNSVYDEVVLLEETFKTPLSNALWNYQIDQRDILLKNLYGLNVISGVELYSNENILLKEFGEIDKISGEVYSFPLEFSFHGISNHLGYIKLYSKEEVVIDRVKVGFLFIIVNSVIKTAVLLVLFLWAFNKFLSRPLNDLGDQVSKIDLSHLENNSHLRHYKRPQNPDELELFKESFSIMLENMSVSKKKLDRLNRTLDEKVKIKTSELQNSLDDFKALLDSTIEGIIIFDEDKKCVDLNDTFLEIFGFENKEEVIGKDLLEFVEQESLVRVQEKLNSNDYLPYEVNLVKKNKDVFPALARGKYVKIRGKNMRISAVIDISKLKEQESMLLQNGKLAAMGEMIGNIAHQWRQPLSAISTVASGLEIQNEMQRVSDEDISKACDMINKNTQYLSKTIDDFRDYIQGDSIAVEFNLVDNIESFLDFIAGTQKENQIKIETNLNKDIRILGYPNELIQCFINIFNNAKDAMNEKNLHQENRYLFISTFEENKKVYIEFKDNAGGIPQSIIDKIFEPYFTTKHKAQGTGLGLHMSYNLIVNGMDGNIKVTNQHYQIDEKSYTGACFVIELPTTVNA